MIECPCCLCTEVFSDSNSFVAEIFKFKNLYAGNCIDVTRKNIENGS